MHDGKAWINLYELGQRKIDKYRQIKRVNDLITSATRVQPSHTTEF